jgi:hypothetical protein
MMRLFTCLITLAWALASPGCGGDHVGSRCIDNRDCGGDTYCCREGKCAGGTCTYECDNDRECPSDMVCRDDKCFFSCNDDRDCDEGFLCKEKDGRLMCVGD